MARWARVKGIDLLGTGDITHPEWRSHMESVLRPADEAGVYRYAGVRFLLSGEISLVWKQNGRGRRIHLVILVPSLAAAKRISRELSKSGNLTSDGRPMLGVSARDAVTAIRTASPGTLVIPAHIWTPWYSVFGAKSGFDSLEECFGEHAEAIHAVETGLSSDPAMNRRWSALDNLRLVSFSDAHSVSKLGREATVFEVPEITFGCLAQALETGTGFAGTIEYRPELGKYHYDGHRSCGVSWTPRETRAHGGICPVCGKPVTIGVLHRVETLCDREEPTIKDSVSYVIPLDEILGWVRGVGTGSQRVQREAEQLVAGCGSEMRVLLDAPEQTLREASDAGVAGAILAARCGEIPIRPGFDGCYGRLEAVSLSDDAATPVCAR